MTPDEYEARLRDAVHRAISDLMCRGYFGLPSDIVDAVLDAYADWLRLRERAEYGCRPEYHDGSLVIDKPCPGHAAEQQIAAILAAAGGTE